MCLGCGGVCVSGWLGLGSGRVGCVMTVCVVNLDSLWRWQVQVSVYCAWRIPGHFMCTHSVFNTVALYQYLLHNMYLSVADIANPDFLGCYCQTWSSLDITRFYEKQCQPPMRTGKSGSHCWAWTGLTQFTQILTDSSTMCRMCRLEPPQCTWAALTR